MESFSLPILSILIPAKRVAIFISRFRASKTSSFLFEGKMVLYSKICNLGFQQTPGNKHAILFSELFAPHLAFEIKFASDVDSYNEL